MIEKVPPVETGKSGPGPFPNQQDGHDAYPASLPEASSGVLVGGNNLQDVPQDAPASTPRRRGNKRSDNSYEHSVSRATWVIAFATGCGVLASALQFEAISGQLNEMREGDRAWITIRQLIPVALPPSPEFEHLFRFDLRPANVGKTIAKDVVVTTVTFGGSQCPSTTVEDQTSSLTGNGMVDQATGLPEPGVPSRTAPSSIAPGAESIAPIPILGNAPRQYSPGSIVYDCMVGSISYRDDFGKSHWTSFCLYPVNDAGELRYCKHGNAEGDGSETSTK